MREDCGRGMDLIGPRLLKDRSSPPLRHAQDEGGDLLQHVPPFLPEVPAFAGTIGCVGAYEASRCARPDLPPPVDGLNATDGFPGDDLDEELAFAASPFGLDIAGGG